MNVSLKWLNNYIKIDNTPQEIAEMLTAIGLEVEGISEVESVKGGLKGLVIGEVLTCVKHPDADKLSLTTVNIGCAEPVQIVCGAPNVAAGQKVVVATVGTTLYTQDGDEWTIKKGKIRGETSEGMICAEDEIGLGSGHDGIMVLDNNAKVGLEASKYFELESDVIFDVNLTPNRSDATCHLGVAKDLAAYLKINQGTAPNIKEPETSSFHVNQRTHPIKVEVENKEACPRYAGLTITNLTIAESPKWLKNKLNAIGVRPINNVVDITNFILHELGQPLHAFDYDKIENKEIRVKTLSEGTKFNALDEKERTLFADDLMICDGNDYAMCMAGIFGGINSGVTNDTKTIFLESAHFNAGFVRKSSMKHVLRTDAAKVFEKGSDPNIVITALKRAAIMIAEIAGGVISSDIEDLYSKEIKPCEIFLRYEMVNKIIGTDLSKEQIHDILQALDMEIQPVDQGGIKVFVPTNKVEVTREIDLIEEILRIYGFNNIQSTNNIKSTLSHDAQPDKRKVINIIADFLAANRFNEMMNLSLIESKHYKEEYNNVEINNTSNIHLDILRPEMLKSGLTAVSHNINRQQVDLKLFEIGKSYQKLEGSFNEREYLTLFITGRRKAESWLEKDKSDVTFHDMKGYVDNIFSKLGISGFQSTDIEDSRMSYGQKYHRGPMNLALYGEVSDEQLKEMGIKNEVYYAEIDIENIMNALKKVNIQIEDISKYPAVNRDLALVIDQSVKFEEIKRLAFKADKKILREVNLFDYYVNEEHLGKGKKSYAVSFKFENFEKTLNDKEIDKTINKMIYLFENELNAVIRK